jgi:hypothetical protein
MAKVTIAGNSYVITSAVAMADLETVKKYRPSALAITDPETKETLFRVGIGAGSVNDFDFSLGIGAGSVNNYDISFGGVSNDDAKHATVTMPIPADVENAKEYVLDAAGMALVNLEKVEAEIAEVLGEIRTERNSIAESIKVSV